MTYSRLFAAALVAALTMVGSAHAAVVNYTGDHYDVGTVAIGQTGTVSTNTMAISPLGVTLHDFISGYLPADSEITFTYSLPNHFAAHTSLYAYGAQSTHNSSATATVSVGGGSSSSSTSNSGLIIASANLTGAKTGTTTIINNASSSAYFLSALESARTYAGLVVKYTVSSLAAVPLPASLPMFALLLAVMGVLGYRQKVRVRSNG